MNKLVIVLFVVLSLFMSGCALNKQFPIESVRGEHLVTKDNRRSFEFSNETGDYILYQKPNGMWVTTKITKGYMK